MVSRFQTRFLCGMVSAIFLAAPAFAQSPGTKVALVDISLIFQKNQRFSATMEMMKKEIEQFEESVKGRRQALQAKGEALKQYQPGSPEYRRDEASLAKESADLQVDIGLKKKEIMEREAKVYHAAYQEVVNHVAAIARTNGYGIVLRYNSSTIDPTERSSVLAGVNRSIIYQNKLDITELVLRSINSQGGAAPPTAPARPTTPGIPPRVSTPSFPARK